MEGFSRSRFQSVWSLAVVLCAILAVLTTFIVSCTKAPDGSAPAQPKTEQAQPAEAE